MRVFAPIVALFLLITGVFFTMSAYYRTVDTSVDSPVVTHIGDDRLNYELGFEQYQQAKEQGIFSATGQHSFRMAETLFIKTVLASPADSYAWFLLAKTWLTLGEADADIAHAIYMSAIAAPYDFTFMNARISTALMVWDDFSPEERQYMEGQIRLYWDVNPVNIAVQPKLHRDIARQLLDLEQQKITLQHKILSQNSDTLPEDYLTLAAVYFMETGASYRVADYLLQSMKSAPYRTPIHLARLQLVMHNWDYLTIEGREEARRQIRIGLKMYPDVMRTTFVQRKHILIINEEVIASPLFDTLEQ